MLVEDNPHDVKLTLRELEKYGLGMRVTVLGDGAAALDYIFSSGEYTDRCAADDPHVLMLDLTLPKVSGLEVLRALKSARFTRRISVVLLINSPEDIDVADRYELGISGTIVKPVDLDQFAEAMKFLGRHRDSFTEGILPHPAVPARDGSMEVEDTGTNGSAAARA